MKFFPLRLAGLYCLLGLLWIYTSDFIINTYFPVAVAKKLQSVKGTLFVLLTAIVVYLILKQYKKTIDQQEYDYLKMFRENPNPMWVYDIESLCFLTANHMTVAKYGYKEQELLQMHIKDLMVHEPTPEQIEQVTQLADESYADAGVWAHKLKSGEVRYMHIYSHPTIFNGKRARVVVAIDETEKVKATEELEVSERKLNGLINNTDDIIWLFDKDARIVTFNDAFARKIQELTGLVPQKGVSFDLRSIPHIEPMNRWLSYHKAAMEGRHLKVEEELEHLPQGMDNYYEVSINPIPAQDGSIQYVGCFARNITMRIQNEQMIRRQVNTLKEIAWIQSHQVRKPLANIMGLVELMDPIKCPNTEMEEIIPYVKESCDELDAMVRKVIDRSADIKRVDG
jgi:PAS domain S-box-containing protein